jgi:hypothetical protein
VRDSRETALAFWSRVRADHQFKDVRMIGENTSHVRAIGRVTASRGEVRTYPAEYAWKRIGGDFFHDEAHACRRRNADASTTSRRAAMNVQSPRGVLSVEEGRLDLDKPAKPRLRAHPKGGLARSHHPKREAYQERARGSQERVSRTAGALTPRSRRYAHADRGHVRRNR